MRYIKPKSVSWLAGLALMVSGIMALVVQYQSGVSIADIVAGISVAESPWDDVFAGAAIIGLRGAIE